MLFSFCATLLQIALIYTFCAHFTSRACLSAKTAAAHTSSTCLTVMAGLITSLLPQITLSPFWVFHCSHSLAAPSQGPPSIFKMFMVFAYVDGFVLQSLLFDVSLLRHPSLHS